MRLRALILAVAFLWTDTAFAHPMSGRTPVAEIPYNVDYEGWVTVEVTINGKGPYDFIVDSGATITAVFQNLVGEHNFAPSPQPPIRILGLTAAKHLPAFTVGDVNVAGQPMADHVGVILPDWAPPRRTPQGVLGLDFLSRYTVFVDTNTRVIRLYDPSLPPERDTRDWSHTDMTKDGFGQDQGALYRIDVRMNSRSLPCIVDLGAAGTLLNYSALRKLLSGLYINDHGSFGFTTGSRLRDVFDNTERARLVRLPLVKIAAARWRDQIFTVYDAPIFFELGVGQDPFCLVGSDLMLQHNFMFDFAREELYMGPKTRYRPADTG